MIGLLSWDRLTHRRMSNVPQPRDNKVYTFEGRNFSQFGLHNNIHCLPVDEVSPGTSAGSSCWLLIDGCRMFAARGEKFRLSRRDIQRTPGSRDTAQHTDT